MATYLTPEIYEALKYKKSPGGFTLEKVIQVGVDSPGHPWERASGVIAGDKESYEVFSLLFDKIIEDLHDHDSNSTQTRDIQTQGIERGDFDGKYVKSMRLTALRSLRGYRLPAACSRHERREIEHAVRLALCRLQGDFKGEYFAVADLTDSYKKRLSTRMLLPDPTAPVIACSGRARDWPDARGIFISSDKSFMVIVNETDHLQIVCLSKESHLLATFNKLCQGLSLLEEELQRNGEEIAWSDHLGYIVSDPANLGTGLDIKVRVKLRRLSVDNRLRYILKVLNLKRSRRGIHSVNIPKGEFYVYTTKTLGVTEVQMLQILIDGVDKLIQLEVALEKGEDIDDMLPESEDSRNKHLDCSAADFLAR
ncbi:hypothetical protein QZH41_019453 [Actinostola sp. cb2023]|nr:hypothetical protein QZH41_019453 [Actinostola sp. cb2023]